MVTLQPSPFWPTHLQQCLGGYPPPFFGESWEGGCHVGVLKVILPTKAIMLLPGVTPVASRFSIPREAVTISIYGLSPPTWSEGVGESSLSSGLVVGMIQFSAMAGLAAHGFIRSLRMPVSILVTGTITSFLGRTFCGHRQVVPADKVVGSARMVSPGFQHQWWWVG